MTKDYNEAKDYFDGVSTEWNRLYSEEKSLINLINRYFRRTLYERYKFAFEKCKNIKNARILDIGCGTGKYCIEFAKSGAEHVVGIDIAPSMIEFSNIEARKEGVEKCHFVCENFIEYNFDENFDYVIAMGFFDYVKDPKPIYDKVSELNPKKFIASFPKYRFFWGLQRYIRYYLIKNCPVYYYEEEEVINSLKSIGCSKYELLSFNTGFVVSGEFN